MAIRVLGIIVSGAAWMAAFGAASAQSLGVSLDGAWVWISAVGGLAGLPVAASLVGARSPGALDNASGVAAVLQGALLADRRVPLGVLLTSAEELGLAGARAWAASPSASGWARKGAGSTDTAADSTAPIAINCDGVDDAGALVCMYTTRRSARPVPAIEAAAQSLGLAIRVRSLVPGMLVDAVALADARWEAATLSRASWRTLARIHSPADRADRLTGAGVAEASAVLARTVEALAKDA
jgi:hypothetical protein